MINKPITLSKSKEIKGAQGKLRFARKRDVLVIKVGKQEKGKKKEKIP